MSAKSIPCVYSIRKYYIFILLNKMLTLKIKKILPNKAHIMYQRIHLVKLIMFLLILNQIILFWYKQIINKPYCVEWKNYNCFHQFRDYIIYCFLIHIWHVNCNMYWDSIKYWDPWLYLMHSVIQQCTSLQDLSHIPMKATCIKH